MVYTLTNGAQGYNNRLHYSLYGGVEYFPDRSRAFKELLPLVAIPTVAIALLVALINFHIPVLSPAGSGEGTIAGSSASSAPRTLSLSSSRTAGSSTAAAGSAASTAGTATNNGIVNTSTPGTVITPLGNDNGQGMIGGRGGGDITPVEPPATIVTPVTPPATDPLTTPLNTPLVQADTTLNTQQPQAGVDVFAPVLDTGVSAGLTL